MSASGGGSGAMMAATGLDEESSGKHWDEEASPSTPSTGSRWPRGEPASPRQSSDMDAAGSQEPALR